jgi:hypothetical protein
MTATDERLTHIRAVQEKYTDQLMRKAHVIGVSVGQIDDSEGELALVVLVDKDIPNYRREPKDRIPDVLDGVKVLTRKVGTIAAY